MGCGLFYAHASFAFRDNEAVAISSSEGSKTYIFKRKVFLFGFAGE